MYGGMTVDRILAWIKATRHSKQLRSLKTQKGDWKTVIVKDNIPPEYLHNDMSSYESMRRARVHLDTAALVLYRALFATFDLGPLWIYLFVDGSPQFRGKELFASSFDVISIGAARAFFDRRHFTQIQIHRELFSALGKATALIWQVFLQVGPRYHAMRDFCNAVAGITTDFGTESKLPDMRDILIPFLKALGVSIPRTAVKQTYLFPHALNTIGWFHLWDNIIRYGLCNLIWFAFFLRCLKTFCKFLRNESEELVKLYESHDLPGTAAVIRILHIPSFIEWRWGTLTEVCKAVKTPLSLLRSNVHVVELLLGKLQDTVTCRLVRIVLTSEDWSCQYKFTDWYCRTLGFCQSWGGSLNPHPCEITDPNELISILLFVVCLQSFGDVCVY